MSYQVLLNSAAKKDLKALVGGTREKVIGTLKAMQEDPFTGNHKKLSGNSGTHRIRVGDFRIIYTVDHSEKVIKVVGIPDRKDAY